MTDDDTDSTRIGIGALSMATGVPTETLRTWERRYGAPTAVRTEGGHRLYLASEIDRIRKASEAMSRGVRASHALRLGPAQLDQLLAEHSPRVPSPSGGTPPAADARPMSPEVASGASEWLAACRRFDRPALDARLVHELVRRGALDFMEGWLTPMLYAMGDAWARGELSEAQEHFGSEAVLAALSALWTRESSEGPRVAVLSTLPGEHHALGLHMAAVVAEQAGCRVVFLGRNTPLRSLVAAVRAVRPDYVVISVSAAMEAGDARVQLAALVAEVGEVSPVLVGGAGAPRGLASVVRFETLTALAAHFNAPSGA